jgi:O-antigen/teichoic acid export membrane protein
MEPHETGLVRHGLDQRVLLLGGMTSGILAARLLGPADCGFLAAVLFWSSLSAAAARWSLGDAIIWRVAQAPERAPTVVVSAILLALATAFVTLSMGAPLLPLLLGEARR